MSLTVQAAQGGSTTKGLLLRVVVLTGAAPAGAQTGATVSHLFASTTAWTTSITTTQTGSRVYGTGTPGVGSASTAAAATTLIDNVADTTNGENYVTFKATSLTGTPGATTLGFTATGGGGAGPMVMLEILTAGGLTEDSSGPAAVSTTAVTSVTTASFSPPAGSLLVAMVSSDGGAGVVTMTVSGGNLNWTQKVVQNASGKDYAGIWVAQVPLPVRWAAPVRSRISQQAPGRAFRSQLTTAAAPAPPSTGPVCYLARQAVRARLPQQPSGPGTRRGAVSFSKSSPPVNPVSGPVFRQATRPARAPVPQNRPGGAFASSPGSSMSGSGRASWCAGAPVSNPSQGPVFRPKPSPVHVIVPRWQPRSGRIGTSFSTPVQNPVNGPPFYPFRQAVRSGVPRAYAGSAFTRSLNGSIGAAINGSGFGDAGGSAGSPVRNPVQGPRLYQKAGPSGARITPLSRGRAYSSPVVSSAILPPQIPVISTPRTAVRARTGFSLKGRVYGSLLARPVFIPSVPIVPGVKPVVKVRAGFSPRGRVYSSSPVPAAVPPLPPAWLNFCFKQAVKVRAGSSLRGRVYSSPPASAAPQPPSPSPVVYRDSQVIRARTSSRAGLIYSSVTAAQSQTSTPGSWAFVQSASNGSSNGSLSSISVTYGSSVSSGHKLIALATSDGAQAVPGTWAAQDASGNMMTLIASAFVADKVEIALLAMDVPAGDAGTSPVITATYSHSGDMSILVQEVSGLAPGNTLAAMIDGTAGTSSGASSPTTNPGYSSTASSEYLIACFGDNLFSNTYTGPAGYTGDPNSITSTSVCHVAIYYKNSTDGTETGQYSFTAAADYGSVLVAFKLAPASGGGSPAGVSSHSTGRVSFSSGAPVQNPQTGTAVPYSLRQAVRARLPRFAFPGQVSGSGGSPAQNPVSGPVFHQAATPVRARSQQPLRGRVFSSRIPVHILVPPVTAGPVFYPARSPSRSRVLPFFRGRIISGRGGPVQNSSSSCPLLDEGGNDILDEGGSPLLSESCGGTPSPGPVFYPAVTPARARVIPPARGRVISGAGGPVHNPVPPVSGPVFRPATQPARARLVLPRHGIISSRLGAPVRNPITGPAFHQAPQPARIRLSLPPRGRMLSGPGGPVSNPFPSVAAVFTVGPPQLRWTVSPPVVRWQN